MQGQLSKLRREESQPQSHFDASYWGQVLKEQEQAGTEGVAQAMAAPMGSSPGPQKPLQPHSIASAVRSGLLEAGCRLAACRLSWARLCLD